MDITDTSKILFAAVWVRVSRTHAMDAEIAALALFMISAWIRIVGLIREDPGGVKTLRTLTQA